MFDKIKSDTASTMEKSIESFQSVLSKIRAGRPNPSILDQIMVNYFDSNTPINQLANITVSDASTISLSVWDKNAVNNIEKALTESNLGVNPVVNGTTIHIKFPPLTQERRLDLNKIVKKCFYYFDINISLPVSLWFRFRYSYQFIVLFALCFCPCLNMSSFIITISISLSI